MDHPNGRSGRLAASLNVLTVGACAGLFAGLVLAAIAGFRRLVLHQLTFANLDTAWMAPLGTLAVFMVLSIPLALLAAVQPRLLPFRLLLVFFTLLATVSILLLFKQLAPVASVLLSVGIAWSVSGRLAAREVRTLRAARRATVAMSLVAAALALLVLGVRPAISSRALARLPAARTGAPNILLLILDTVRGDELGVQGYPQPTSPRIDQFAARGVVFEQAFAPSAWTLASHASMFTGRRPGELSARWWTPLDGAQPTLAEALRDQGYRTAGFAANYYYTGLEGGLARGFLHYEDVVRTWRQVLWSASLPQMPLLRDLYKARSRKAVWAALRRHDITIAGRSRARDHKTADRVTGDLLQWLDRQKAGPFFAFINFFDAHERRERLEPEFDRFGTGDRARYDGFLARIDQSIGKLLDELARRGVLENTIVVITSDHGEMFGEHGLKGHGNGLHLPVLRVPLIVVYPPGVPAGIRVAAPVGLQHIAATLLELTAPGSPPALPGRSLAEYWRGPPGTVAVQPVFSEVEKFKDPENPGPAQLGPMRSLIDAQWHYILNGDGTEELYDWTRDPGELDNLAAKGRVPPPDFARLSAAARAFPSSYGGH